MCTDSEQQQCVEIENRVRYAYLRGRYVYRLEEVSVHLQTSGFAMCTSQGCFGLFRGRYVYPYLHIYQAGAQRTLGALAPPLLLLTLRALPALHVVHPMRPLHPMHHVHQCSRFTTTVRDHAGTAWNGGAVESLRRLRPRPTAPLSSLIHSWKYDPKGGAIEAA